MNHKKVYTFCSLILPSSPGLKLKNLTPNWRAPNGLLIELLHGSLAPVIQTWHLIKGTYVRNGLCSCKETVFKVIYTFFFLSTVISFWKKLKWCGLWIKKLWNSFFWMTQTALLHVSVFINESWMIRDVIEIIVILPLLHR